MMHYGPKGLLDGLNPVVIAVGIPYAFFAVLIFGYRRGRSPSTYPTANCGAMIAFGIL
jgi:hypothetical protein